jgi:hypothetical protein
MENQENNQKQEDQQLHKDNTVGGAQTNQPDAESQNDTGYAGTTNSLSENSQKDGYGIAPEDTMIGYDGDESQMDMELDEEDESRAGSSAADDNA